MVNQIVHRAYKTARNQVHYYWEWMEYEQKRPDGENKTTRITVHIPVKYIRFDYPDGTTGYMPLSEMLANGLGGLVFGTASEAIKIERGANG